MQTETSKAELPKKRQRAKSMFAERSRQPFRAGQNKQWITTDDMHKEIAERFKLPDRGLKPVQQRKLAEPLPIQMTSFQKFFEEFKAKLQAKKCEK